VQLGKPEIGDVTRDRPQCDPGTPGAGAERAGRPARIDRGIAADKAAVACRNSRRPVTVCPFG
jgi:hypothetical protein